MIYTAFFRGQGGRLFSWGIPHMAKEAARLGAVDTFDYSEADRALDQIKKHTAEGLKIALVGYSLGASTATFLQSIVPVDLVLAIAESRLGDYHPINKATTKHSVLWAGPGILSSGGHDDGFDVVHFVHAFHLWMDVSGQVAEGVQHELEVLNGGK